jgi:hypothetical protein
MVEEFQSAAKTQATEIYDLEGRIDDLTEQRDSRACPPLSLSLD